MKAIDVLARRLDDIESIECLDREMIQEIIDPILVHSEYAVGLRERLKELD